MSHLTKSSLFVPPNIKVVLYDKKILIRGKFGELMIVIHNAVNVKYVNSSFIFSQNKGYYNSRALIGTTRALLSNMLIGVMKGFTRSLQLVGVGYRVILKEGILSLFVGFSHVVNYVLPQGIVAKCPNQNEIILIGADKQLVGQVAADLRSLRIPERYKGKGIRYVHEIILLKDAKKK
ncbi:MAG: 50S ribosomal subunit protein L6 [Candidatus Westeberhardia cardiocondylae]|nr:50S ribosomal subunit protein L6 [Candidatus Westeberhardia cardiocondylae]